MKPGHVIGALAAAAITALVIYNYRQKQLAAPPVYYLPKPAGSYNGYTVPPFGIFIKESERGNAALLHHELKHWEQYRREGFWKFVLGYAAQAYRHGYDANPYEREARANEPLAFCHSHYTYCVRNGLSATAYNPAFRR